MASKSNWKIVTRLESDPVENFHPINDEVIIGHDEWMANDYTDGATSLGSIIIIEKPISVKHLLRTIFEPPLPLGSFGIRESDILVKFEGVFKVGLLIGGPTHELGFKQCVLLRRNGFQVEAFAITLK